MATALPDSAAFPLDICLFGPCEVRVHGLPLPRLRSRKGYWLLALLALRRGVEVDRAWLAATVWPDSLEPQALGSLRISLKDLRRALGVEASRLRSPTSRTLALDLVGAQVDVLGFDAAIARGDPVSLAAACSLYRGPLLEECSEEWVFQERQARAEAYLAALERLAADAMAGGDPVRGERYARRAVAVDPLRESAQRGLMEAVAAGGNYAAALATYRELRRLLHRELNADVDAETRTLYEAIRAEARQKAALPLMNDPRPTAHEDSRSALVAGCSPLVMPEGTLTFLFTDIEGSTRLWEEHAEAMQEALARHDALLHHAIEANGGCVFKTVGDQFCAAFASAPAALEAALAAQHALASSGVQLSRCPDVQEVSPEHVNIATRSAGTRPEHLKVRMALHSGAVEARDGDYFGPPLNRVKRLLDAGHGGQILLSAAARELTSDRLPAEATLRDLGSHRLRDLQQPEQLFQLLHPDLPADFPPLRSLEAFAHNLPGQWTRFIGRERTMAEVKRLLTGSRLLTLTGAGGCGKTRLALQVAANVLAEYHDGVWLVELASLADPALVPRTVVFALGLREDPARTPSETLLSHLRPRSLLLLLDNCEHLLSACAELAVELLRGCPQLRLLATSREGLGIMGEQTYPVPPLSLPDPTQLPPLERLQEFEAVQLFTDRARLSQATFALTQQNAAAVAQVCQQLDGIPLAIELAAARVKALPVEKLNERLDDMFRLLTGGSRTALPRQQTLRALIDWSYDLLSPSEKALLRRLSVFAGGWTLEAAEAVCVGEGVEEWEMLDLLTSLVEKSLVLYEEGGGEGRYRLLETVRQYARDRLLEAGEAEDLRERHLEFFLNWAEQGPGHERLETEHDNLRAALGWSGAQGPVEVGLRLGRALYWFWYVRGYVGEGREHLAGLLALPGGAPPRSGGPAPTAARANALQGAGWLAQAQGDYGGARALYEESLVICRELGPNQGIANPLVALGSVALSQADYGTARALYEESLTIQRELGNKPGIASSLCWLGIAASQHGDNGEARALLEESLAIQRELGNKPGIAWSSRCLGSVALSEGDSGAARALLEESLAISRELGHKPGIVQNLEGLAAVAVAQGQPVRAARLFGAAEGLREAMGAPLHPAERAGHDRSVAAVRTALGEEAFAAAWAEGRRLPLEQIIAEALQEAPAG